MKKNNNAHRQRYLCAGASSVEKVVFFPFSAVANFFNFLIFFVASPAARVAEAQVRMYKLRDTQRDHELITRRMTPILACV